MSVKVVIVKPRKLYKKTLYSTILKLRIFYMAYLNRESFIWRSNIVFEFNQTKRQLKPRIFYMA